MVREPHSKEAPVLRLWVDVNVGGTSLDPAPCSSQFGSSQDPPRGAPLTGWDTGRAVGHSEWMLQGPPHAALGRGPPRHRAEPTPSPGNPATLTGCQQLEAPGQTPGAVPSGRVLRRAPCSSVLLRGPRLLPKHSGSTKTWPPPSRPQSGAPDRDACSPPAPQPHCHPKGLGPQCGSMAVTQGCPVPPLRATPAGSAQAVPSSRTPFLLRPTLQLQHPSGFLCKVIATHPPTCPRWAARALQDPCSTHSYSPSS